MIDRIINNKISWIVLGVILVVLIIIVIPKKEETETTESVYLNPEEVEQYLEEVEEKVIFELKGDENVSIYVNDTYNDSGFTAILNDETDLSSNVEVVNNVDTSKEGTYEVTYILNYKGAKKELKRQVTVMKVISREVNIRLIGDEIIYLNVGEEYKELGAVATLDGKDLSEDIKIDSNVDTSTKGEYKVKYKIENKEIERQVIVFDIDDFFYIDSDNSLIKVTLNDSFMYIKLPNGLASKEKIVSYDIPGNGNYEFTLYTKELVEYKKVITIKNKTLKEEEKKPEESVITINQDPPTGTCEAILKDGKTTVTVTSDSNIVKYYYNGVESNSSVYNVNKFLRKSSVILVGENGKKAEISCNVKMEYMDVISTGKGEKNKYKYESDSLKAYINYKSGYWVTRLWVKDPVNQLNKQFTTGKKLQTGNKILESAIGSNYTNKIVIGFNASMPIDGKKYGESEVSRYPDLAYKEKSALIIQNGKVLVNEVRYGMADDSKYIAYIDSNNQLSYLNGIKSMTQAERGVAYQKIIDSGARNTIVWFPVMIDNYKTRTLTKTDKGSTDNKSYRQGLCQVDTNNFILVTTKSSSGLAKRQTFANFMGTLGCRVGLNFDGGGSIITMYKPKGTNKISILTYGNENRKLSSIMYFTEL